MEAGYIHNHEFAFSRFGQSKPQEQARHGAHQGQHEDKNRKPPDYAQAHAQHSVFCDVQNIQAFQSTPVAKPLVVCRDSADEMILKKRNRDWDDMEPTSTADSFMFDAYSSPNVKRVKAFPHS